MSLSDIFNKNASGDTALMHAVKNADAETVKKLLDIGGNANVKPAPKVNTGPSGPVDIPKPQRHDPPLAPKARVSSKDITEMATERKVKAPATARFKKKPTKRETTL